MELLCLLAFKKTLHEKLTNFACKGKSSLCLLAGVETQSVKPQFSTGFGNYRRMQKDE